MARIGYVGAFDEHYPRNQIIRAGLEAHGFAVKLAQLPRDASTLSKIPLLWRAMRREAGDCDALIVAEFNPLLAPLAVLLGRLLRKPVLVDYMVGLYDSNVLDREATRRRSPRALAFRAIDGWNIATAPGVFTDTVQHRDFFRRLIGPPARRLTVVPVGAYTPWWTPPNPPPQKRPGEPLRVQFFGHYIPFHGVQVIVRALSWFNTDDRFRFELIGRGQLYQDAVRRAELLGVRHLTFCDPVPPPELPALVAQADICLGVFARRSKTDYVVPNKVFQCMAMGKPVITAESAAIEAHFTPGEHLITVPPSDPGELAYALRALADDAEQRRRLGEAAAAIIRERYTPEKVVEPLVGLLGRMV